MNQSDEENLEAIDILLTRCHEELNDWEVNFLEDIALRLESGKHLSDKQQEKLDDIFERTMNI